VPFQRVSTVPVAATSSRPSVSRRCSAVPGNQADLQALCWQRGISELPVSQREVLRDAGSDNRTG
jgi:hypothetical protein